jgi:nitroreductase
MAPSFDLFEAIRTTRAMRRLDPAKPVSDEDLWTIIEAATKAPSGGNSQPVRWIVVRDAEKRKKLGDIYREAWSGVGKMYRARTDPSDTTTSRVLNSADHLGDHMGDAPVILVPAAKNGDPGSVFPAIQNLFLAARALGLGTTLTTVHQLKEQDVRDVLGVPEEVKTFALIPVGYPTGRWGEAQRRPVEEVTYWDNWRETRTR